MINFRQTISMDKNLAKRKYSDKQSQIVSQPNKLKKFDTALQKKKNLLDKSNSFSKKLMDLNKENDNAEDVDAVESSDDEIQLEIEDLKQVNMIIGHLFVLRFFLYILRIWYIKA